MPRQPTIKSMYAIDDPQVRWSAIQSRHPPEYSKHFIVQDPHHLLNEPAFYVIEQQCSFK